MAMPSEYNKILEFNQYQKSDKAPFFIYENIECLIEQTNGQKNNPESSSTTKAFEILPLLFSTSTISIIKKHGK